jgi:arsenate reductase
MKKRVLFLCTGNSARSQMAEALLRSIAGSQYEVFSAGTDPKGIHPLTIEAMRAVGIDITGQISKDVRGFAGQQFDYIITVCDRARKACPVLPGSIPLHWGFEDPAEPGVASDSQLKTFQRVRDEIGDRIRSFVAANKSIDG